MGRPQKSATLIALNGNPGKLSRAELKVRQARAKAAEFTSMGGVPKIPKFLSENAVAIWKQTIKLMKKKGTCSEDAGPMLQLYCEISARWIVAKNDLETRGIQILQTKHDKQGAEYQVEITNPNLGVATDCERQLLALARSLGITPDTRTKVEPTPNKKDEPGNVLLGFITRQQQ